MFDGQAANWCTEVVRNSRTLDFDCPTILHLSERAMYRIAISFDRMLTAGAEQKTVNSMIFRANSTRVCRVPHEKQATPVYGSRKLYGTHNRGVGGSSPPIATTSQTREAASLRRLFLGLDSQFDAY